jgi:predicted DNA-binding transcriptional regulator YafY
LKLLYICDIIKDTDENSPLSANDIIKKLAAKDVVAERKSIYSDIECLKQYGLDIERNNGGYYLASRDFETPELKLLVDAVQCSRFITQKKSISLIKKIESLCSKNQAQSLHRQVYVFNRIKTMNESIYYNVDDIHSAIEENRKITFKYFDYGVDKKKRYRNDGALYNVSPYALTWEDENYYLIAYDSAAEKIKHYRVDKMENIQITPFIREGEECFLNFDLPSYSRGIFGMYGGEKTNVKIRFENSLSSVIIDRFGKEIIMIPDGNNHFTINLNVAVSPQFYAWVFGFGEKAKVISPKSVVDEIKNTINSLNKEYTEA